jgi:hypothetical protein
VEVEVYCMIRIALPSRVLLSTVGCVRGAKQHRRYHSMDSTTPNNAKIQTSFHRSTSLTNLRISHGNSRVRHRTSAKLLVQSMLLPAYAYFAQYTVIVEEDIIGGGNVRHSPSSEREIVRSDRILILHPKDEGGFNRRS